MKASTNSLRPGTPSATDSEGIDINLFAGAGGLAVGLIEAGFSPSRFFELDPHCCQTLRHNLQSRLGAIRGTVYEGDVRKVDWRPFADKVRLLAGGVPCQPFSLAGKHLAERDNRNLFPEILRAIRETRPVAVLIENVRGLLRSAFQPYFEYVLRQLEIPSVELKPGESWRDHDQRIRRHQGSSVYRPEYHVTWRLVDAADYGVAQNRHRVFIVATMTDLPACTFPEPTHSRGALLGLQLSGEYWDLHGIVRAKAIPNSNNGSGNLKAGEELLPWVTVRDAFLGLPAPARHESEARFNHWIIPGARVYSSHTGSALDWPSKTIKAGVHGVPGGENVVVDDLGRVRYYTLRETARLQSFPDDYFFEGARLHVTRQIGNAVPCALAAAVAEPLFRLLSRNSSLRQRAKP